MRDFAHPDFTWFIFLGGSSSHLQSACILMHYIFKDVILHEDVPCSSENLYFGVMILYLVCQPKST